MLKNYAKYIGKNCLVKVGRTGKCYTECTIKDVRTTYGKTYYQISPLCGKGTVWVEKVKILK